MGCCDSRTMSEAGGEQPRHMAKRVELDSEKLSCSICLDVLKDPVTTSCGHSYCMECIESHWDGEDQKRIYSCPQCRKFFKPRPDLEKNIVLAELVEDLKKTGLQAAAAGPEDTHKLAAPSKNLQENICSRHNEVKKLFCCTDQQLICSLCSVEEHKGHDTVSAEAERTERQRELEESRQNIQQRIQGREDDVILLQQEVEAINDSAGKTVEESEKIFCKTESRNNRKLWLGLMNQVFFYIFVYLRKFC
uniref:RING-type domain-containing protein n=1 Tax=Amphiprion percula TaxID=161767 RepID=A0A3P8RL74_AMPPE